MKDPLRLRPATMDDAARLLEWRNDSKTRSASHDGHVISLEEHGAWLERALTRNDIEIFIAEEDGNPVGTVRSESSAGARKLSWTVAPDARGRGIGRVMVKMMADRIRGPLRAEVKVGNTASARIAESAGLALDREQDGILHYARA